MDWTKAPIFRPYRYMRYAVMMSAAGKTPYITNGLTRLSSPPNIVRANKINITNGVKITAKTIRVTTTQKINPKIILITLRLL